MRAFAFAASVTVFGLFVCFTGPASATTITVDWSGSGDELDIQSGMNAANPGDTVLVLAGTYTGASNRDLDCGGTNLVLLSASGAGATIIDCENAGRGFFFGNGEDTTAVVMGFTISNAVADSGGGAFCINGSNPRFEECSFLNNTALMRGGGLCCVSSSPIIRDCTFEGNLASDGGTGSAYGGAIACLEVCSPEIKRNHFELNTAYLSGGAIYCYYASPDISSCDFVNNNLMSYGAGGGGIALSFADGTTIWDCTFSENGTAQTIVGAGLFVDGSTVTVLDCDFLNNVGGTTGGARFVFNSGGTISGCTFYGNVSSWGYAVAGLECYYNSNPTISGCTFAKNWGHHISCSDASPTIEYCILAFSEAGVP
ncbi:MAG: right-handed parallel beta-helix repeat-containing protein, partial [bacterium]